MTQKSGLPIYSAILFSLFYSITAQAQVDWDAPAIGVQYVDIQDVLPLVENTKIKIPGKIGAVVLDVAPNGPAAGKLGQFDIITKIDQTPIKTAADLKAAVAALKLGDQPLIAGQSHFIGPNGVSRWKKASGKLGRVVTQRQVFINAMEAKVDEITEATTYRHMSTPAYRNQETHLSLIIRKEKDGKPNLLIQTTLVGDVIFTKEILIKVDGKVYTIKDRFNVDIAERCEWTALAAQQHADLVNALIDTKAPVTVRYQGQQDRIDRELSITEMYAMKGAMLAYLAMDGEPIK